MTKLYDLLLNDLRSLRNSFSRLLGLVLLFTLIGHLFIVEPYFGYQDEEHTLSGELNVSKNNLHTVDERLKKLKKVDKQTHQVLSRTRAEIKDFPAHLRRMLPKIRESISAAPSPSLQAQQFRSLPQLPTDIKTFEKGVNWYTNHWFTKIIQKLKNDVTGPILQLKTQSQETAKAKLEQLSKKAMKDISTYTEGIDPDFWHTFSEKTEIAQGLIKLVDLSFKPIYVEINTLTEEIKNTMILHKEKLKSIQANIKKTGELKTDLKNRLDTLQSPIGKIPVSLTDFIKLFPLLIIVLMVMISLHLSKSRRLYSALRETMPKQEEQTEKTAFACVIDCWYLPPYQTVLQPLILTGAIAVIATVFFRSVFLVTTGPELFLSLTGKEETLQMFLYMASYLLGVLVLLGCMWSIRKATSK